ncbi:MAG: hypothetical protein HC915_20205 [Anaerolineae bacterium]|nr:hypothetical protein [Anaerolineae bacterium]
MAELTPELQAIIELEERGYRSTALQRLRDYLDLEPQDPHAWLMRARLEAKPRQQWRALQRALQLAPENARAQALRTALLEEYPWLTPRFFTPGRVFVLLLAGLLACGSLLAALWVGGALPDSPPEVIVAPNTDITATAQAEATERARPSATPPPIPVTLASPTPLWLATETPSATATFTLPPSYTPFAPLPDLAQPTLSVTESAFSLALSAGAPPGQPADPWRVLLAPFQNAEPGTPEALAEALREAYPTGDLEFSVVDAPVASEAEAVALLQSEPRALLVLYGAQSGSALTLSATVDESQADYAQRAALLRLRRPASPFTLQINVTDGDLLSQPALRGLLAFLTNRHAQVVDALSPLFTARGRVLNADEQRLALLLAYSYQVLGDHTPGADALRAAELLHRHTRPQCAAESRAGHRPQRRSRIRRALLCHLSGRCQRPGLCPKQHRRNSV